MPAAADLVKKVALLENRVELLGSWREEQVRALQDVLHRLQQAEAQGKVLQDVLGRLQRLEAAQGRPPRPPDREADPRDRERTDPAERWRELERANQELRRRNGDLESELEELKEEVVRLRNRPQPAVEELAQVKADLARAREGLRVAEAEWRLVLDNLRQERDDAERTFKALLWDVLHDEEETALNPDQRLFRQRLREIRDTLRDLGVPPPE
jgi:chromosome segregation ATPase